MSLPSLSAGVQHEVHSGRLRVNVNCLAHGAWDGEGDTDDDDTEVVKTRARAAILGALRGLVDLYRNHSSQMQVGAVTDTLGTLTRVLHLVDDTATHSMHTLALNAIWNANIVFGNDKTRAAYVAAVDGLGGIAGGIAQVVAMVTRPECGGQEMYMGLGVLRALLYSQQGLFIDGLDRVVLAALSAVELERPPDDAEDEESAKWPRGDILWNLLGILVNSIVSEGCGHDFRLGDLGLRCRVIRAARDHAYTEKIRLLLCVYLSDLTLLDEEEEEYRQGGHSQ